MNNKALTLSLVMAIVAIFFVQSYVSSIEEEQKKRFGTEVMVVKARKEIREMDTINETMLELEPIPKKFLEPNAISIVKKEGDKESAVSLKGLAGNIAVVTIKAGEQITYNKISDASIRTGLSPQIAPGRRAVAVPVTETSGVAKLVKPGDRVDLIAVIDMGGGKENKIAKTVLQDVVVLSIGRYITNNVARSVEADAFGGPNKVKSLAEDFSFGSVTLELEPAQAQLVALLLTSGDNSVVLSLRNNDDTDRGTIPATTFADVLGAEAGKLKAKR